MFWQINLLDPILARRIRGVLKVEVLWESFQHLGYPGEKDTGRVRTGPRLFFRVLRITVCCTASLVGLVPRHSNGYYGFVDHISHQDIVVVFSKFITPQ